MSNESGQLQWIEVFIYKVPESSQMALPKSCPFNNLREVTCRARSWG